VTGVNDEKGLKAGSTPSAASPVMIMVEQNRESNDLLAKQMTQVKQLVS